MIFNVFMPTINIVMAVKDRPRLTKQALETLAAHTDNNWTLALVDDASKPETRDYLRIWSHGRDNVALLRNEKSKGIVGQVKNLGVYWSERYFGRGDWLCICDNDIAFLPKWASQMTEAYIWSVRMVVHARSACVLGGCRHPFHGFDKESRRGVLGDSFLRTDAVAGYHQLMKWETWDKFGPFDAHAVGTGQSEDFAFCRKVYHHGGVVGYIDPPTITHTGITNTAGEPVLGAEQFTRVEGILYA